jgi:3'-phosphoadenosine 5'-phosphosulfate sulfotransferase (PAPS reductase)/FAD synthetase
VKEPRKLLVSFSGGRTSAYMTKRILDTWRERYDEITVLFANTGQEHEKTLEFVRNCDVEFGFGTVWLEADVREAGKGSVARVVDFDTASRDGRPFEDVISKYGIPNAGWPHCTDRLKLQPMRSYIREVLGYKRGEYDQCIGIRADEIDRMSPSASEQNIKYPLVNWCVTKQMIREWWSQQAFDLEIPEHQGNCVWCWKKSDRKLLTLAKHNPEFFDFPMRMEETYHTVTLPKNGVIVSSGFFRGHKTSKDIIASSAEPFIEWTPVDADRQLGMFMDEMDYSNGCSESCEVEYV